MQNRQSKVRLNKRKQHEKTPFMTFRRLIAILMFAIIFCWLLIVGRVFRSSDSKGMISINSPLSSISSLKDLDPLSCSYRIAHRKDADFYDPNKDLETSPSKQTTTNPPFWISLHKEWFDQMRWASIMNNGEYYETGLTKRFKEILAHQNPPGIVIDVGMNIGWFTLWARAHGHTVAGFEPNPVMHIRVCESLALNKWDDGSSVKIWPYGLADVETTMNLTTGKNPGGSSFFEERLAKKFRKSIPVKVVTLDRIAKQEGWLEPSGPPIYLLKVDVEGFESFVFKGGKGLLQSGRVHNIIMENSSFDVHLVTEVLSTIYIAGFRVHTLLSVNGDPYHPEMTSQINEAIEKIPSLPKESVLDDFGEDIKFLVKVLCNIWWVKAT